jgi:chromosome partitioning protein
MFKIAVIAQKGGVGKTTVTLGLAVAAADAQQNVCVIDLDPQANAANWKDRREADNPAVLSAQASRLKATIQTAEKYGADLVVIDTPGRSDGAAIEAARAADLVLVPVHPQIFDLETLPAVRDLLRLAGDPKTYVVLNGIHPQSTKGAQTAREMIEGTFGLLVAPVHLCQRASYADAPTTGRSPQELDPEGKAADETQRLYMFICEVLNTLRGRPHEQAEQDGRAAKRA